MVYLAGNFHQLLLYSYKTGHKLKSSSSFPSQSNLQPLIMHTHRDKWITHFNSIHNLLTSDNKHTNIACNKCNTKRMNNGISWLNSML